jgi:YbgC/YbaW family acyl-CoA thioester hydrolase
MAHEFRLRRQIEFVETDMAGIVHFSNYFRFMEAAEHAFFRSLGLYLHHEQDGRMQGWARVGASCQYEAPLRYRDEVEIHLRVREKTRSTLGYDFSFSRLGPEGRAGTAVARGALTVVFVQGTGGGQFSAARMPEEVARSIEVAPEPTVTRPA